MNVYWTKLAEITYFEIIQNLMDRWSLKEVIEFKEKTTTLIKYLEKGIINCAHDKTLNINKCIIHKNVSLYYREDKKLNKIFLIVFYQNRMNPKTVLKFLK